MLHQGRVHLLQPRKGEDCFVAAAAGANWPPCKGCQQPHHLHYSAYGCAEHAGGRKPAVRAVVLRFFFLLCVVSCTVVSGSRYFYCAAADSPSPICPLFFSFGTPRHGGRFLHSEAAEAAAAATGTIRTAAEEEPAAAEEEPAAAATTEEATAEEEEAEAAGDASSCSSISNNVTSISCDRTAYRTDVCYMKGDVKIHSASNSILLQLQGCGNGRSTPAPAMEEQRIKPYTRKWEKGVMSVVQELRLRTAPVGSDDDDDSGAGVGCDVRHNATAVVFSIGGYTGNVYHAFNDGLIPLYITTQHLKRKVVLVLTDYQAWWRIKYAEIISQLSDHPPIDYTNDRRIHCFPDAIVGLDIHGDLTVDATKMPDHKTIHDFRRLLNDAYRPRLKAKRLPRSRPKSAPKLVIISRSGPRALENEADLVRRAKGLGFSVEVLRPGPMTDMAAIYGALNSSDAMVGVHGAALTHFLFMRPGSVFIQIVPLGTDWAAETYYGEPAAKMGLRYVRYRIHAEESSLQREYPKDHPVVKDHMNVVSWDVTKSVYLDRQTVRLDLDRFGKHLARAHRYLVANKRSQT